MRLHSIGEVSYTDPVDVVSATTIEDMKDPPKKIDYPRGIMHCPGN